MPIRTMRYAALVLGLLLLGGCAKKASDEIDYGVVKDSVYQNKYFGLSLPLPSDWSVQDQEMQKKITETGAKVVAGDDKQMKAVLKASEQQTVHLLMAFQHPVGSPVLSNPGLMCIAEQVRNSPGIKRGKDYHFHAKRLMESGQLKIEFPKEISTEKISGVEFDVMHASLKTGPITVQQKYFATIMKGYALIFVASFTSPEEESMLQKILDGVTIQGS